MEFCAPLESTLSQVAREHFPEVSVLTVTEHDDARKAKTIEELIGLISSARKRGMSVYLCASTPCTGGCPFQRLRLSHYGEGYESHLNALWNSHKKMWVGFTQLTKYVHGWFVEWPQRCACWSFRQTKRFLDQCGYDIYECFVDACSVGMRGFDGLLISKRWRVLTTHEGVATGLRRLKYTASALYPLRAP